MQHDKPARRWVQKFLRKHIDWHQPSEGTWPKPGSVELAEFEQIWDSAFAGNNVTDDMAYAASKRLLQSVDRPRFRNDHLPAILKAVEDLRSENYAQGPGGSVSDSRDQAQSKSAGCPRCSGVGITAVYHPRYDGTRVVRLVVLDRGPDFAPEVIRQLSIGEDAQGLTKDHYGNQLEKIVTQPGTVSAVCVCEYGRWLKAYYDRSKDLSNAFVDLAEVLAGRSRWLAEPPQKNFTESGQARPSCRIGM